MKHKIILSINILLIGFVFGTGYAFAAGSWSAPTGNPPGNNADLPINAGNIGQTKVGGLTINTGGAPTGLVVDQGNVVFNILPVSCDKVITDGSKNLGCGSDRDTDGQTLGTSGNSITLTNGGSVIAPAANNLMGGAAGQIPFQTAANTTGFDSTLIWEANGVYPSHKKLSISTGKLSVIDSASGIYAGNYVIYSETTDGVALYAKSNGGGQAIFGITQSGSYAIAAHHQASGNRADLATSSYAVDAIGKIRASFGFCDSTVCATSISTDEAGASINSLVMRDNQGNIRANNVYASKIYASTYDPVYSINGKDYATYLPGMTGIKEETSGALNLVTEGGLLKQVIDFNKAEVGSDLWLFAKITNLKNNFNNLTVILTPSFDGRVWYEKDVINNKLVIHAAPTTHHSLLTTNFEVSYRFTAPRFDADKWSNFSDVPAPLDMVIND